MSASFLTSVSRLSSSAYPLPAIGMIVGSFLLADAVLCGLGSAPITSWFGGRIAMEIASVSIVSGLFGFQLLIHVFLPIWFAVGRFICRYIPGVRILIPPAISTKPGQFYYLISDVERRAVDKGHKQASDMVNERRAEVDRECRLRFCCAAMFAAFFIDLYFSGSCARQIAAMMREPGLFTSLLCVLASLPLALAFVLALMAFTGVEEDSQIARYPLEGFMKE
jgi:hypothetical protein